MYADFWTNWLLFGWKWFEQFLWNFWMNWLGNLHMDFFGINLCARIHDVVDGMWIVNEVLFIGSLNTEFFFLYFSLTLKSCHIITFSVSLDALLLKYFQCIHINIKSTEYKNWLFNRKRKKKTKLRMITSKNVYKSYNTSLGIHNKFVLFRI